MAVDLVMLGIAMLLAPALAEFAKMRSRNEKGYDWLAMGGVSYLVSVALSNDIGFGLASILGYGSTLFAAVGLIAGVLGVVVIVTGSLKQ